MCACFRGEPVGVGICHDDHIMIGGEHVGNSEPVTAVITLTADDQDVLSFWEPIEDDIGC